MRRPALLLVLFVLVLFASLARRGLAQGPAPVTLTLDDARARALERNPELAVEREAAVISEAGVLRADAPYDLALSADLRYRDRTDPVNFIFSGAPVGQLGPTTESVGTGLGLSQLFSTGGSLRLVSSLSRERTNNTLTPLAPSYVTALGLELRQPLLKDRAIDPARRGLRVARIDRTRSLASLKRVTAETVAAVEKAWWTFVAARHDVDARRSAVALAERQQEDVAARVDAGTLSESDLATPAAEVQRRRLDLFAAREAAARAENALRSLILADPADPLWATPIEPKEDAAPAPGPHDTEEALAAAVASRPEVLEAAARLERHDVDERAAKDRTLPQLDLVAGYTARGLAGGQNPGLTSSFPGTIEVSDVVQGGLGRSWGTLFENRFPDASVGLALSFPLGNSAARADAAIAASTRRQAALDLLRIRQRIEVEVRNAAVGLETAGQRVEAARAGREAAETQLRAEEERFSAGLTTSFFVLTRQNDLTQAVIAETAARADQRRALVEWARATGTLLRDRNVRIEEPQPAAPPAGGTR